MAKEKYQTRLEDVDAERVDKFQDRLDISTKAEATRRLILAGLEYKEQEQEQQDEDDGRERVPDTAATRHGISEDFRQIVLAMLAVFVGGTMWEAGTAFGDFITLIGGF